MAERSKTEAWNTLHEMLATQIELLHSLVNDMRTGIPVVLVDKISRNTKSPLRWPRPAWVQEHQRSPSDGKATDEIVISDPRQLVSIMRGNR